ncbi:uncharacterized protein LOC128550507 [Mercenaria mercenaria]|uniref:uncharacterized protein LOC128550507 n=1 Tax=Mercenaria mercenaria TaxID=6596 RepID=UPI00234EEEE6|nr:uncharacterized protein LOC128550507 [Mercenaria mercenaria]
MAIDAVEAIVIEGDAGSVQIGGFVAPTKQHDNFRQKITIEESASLNQKHKAHAPGASWMNLFDVSIECYCIPSSRVLSHPTALLGPGAGCRSVAVTTINIEKREQTITNQRASKLNSAIYTPVIQWFGIDVKQQVPQYLPMNLWPGSYTVFGFYNPEESGSTCVKLTAKVGSEEVYLEERMETEKCLSSEKWSDLTRLMEKELQKLTSPVKKPSYDPIPEQEHHLVESTVVIEETGQQRVSQDTGYMSTKRSIVQSPYSVRYTSDSEDAASVKERQPYDKKISMRRKDTPAHGSFHIGLSPHPQDFRDRPLQDFRDRPPQDFRDRPLQEESEAKTSSGSDSVSSRPSERALIRPASSLGIHTTDPKKQDFPSPLQLCITGETGISKSYCDLTGTDFLSPVNSPSYSDNGGGKTTTKRRKKRSIISKIGGIPAKVESEISLLGATHALEKEIDVGADADDEEDASHTEIDKLSAYVTKDDQNQKTNGSSRKESEEINLRTTSVNSGKGMAPLPENLDFSLKDEGTIGQTEEGTAEINDLGEDRMEVSDSDINKRIEVQQISFSKLTEPPISCQRDSDARLLYLKDVKENKNESGIFEEVKIKEKEVSDKERSEETEEQIAEGVENVEHKNIDEFEKTSSRPRSRTLSKRNVFENKNAKQKYTRQSKSFSIPSRSSTPKRGGKRKVPPVQDLSNETAMSSTIEPPRTPKEAFSDS